MTQQVLNLLEAGLLLAGLRTIAAHRLDDYIGGFILQSAVLAALALALGVGTGALDLVLVAVMTLFVKVGVVPRILRRVATELPVERGVRSMLGLPASIVVSIGLSVLAFLASATVASSVGAAGGSLGVSLGIVLIGLFLITTRRHVVAQLVGLLTLENGMFAGTLAVAPGMPWIVEFGILLDVLIAVAVIGLLVTLIHREIASADTAALRQLRG
jgi:hydrogenase-4 component E